MSGRPWLATFGAGPAAGAAASCVAHPLSIGAPRFAGRVSTATSVCDILAHVAETVTAAKAVARLRNGLCNLGSASEALVAILRALAPVSGPFLAENCVASRFLDILADYVTNINTDIETAVRLFENFQNHRQILDELCCYILPGVQLPEIFVMSASSAAANLRLPKQLRNMSHRLIHTESDIFVVNALPLYDPYGKHFNPIRHRMQKRQISASRPARRRPTNRTDSMKSEPRTGDNPVRRSNRLNIPQDRKNSDVSSSLSTLSLESSSSNEAEKHEPVTPTIVYNRKKVSLHKSGTMESSPTASSSSLETISPKTLSSRGSGSRRSKRARNDISSSDDLLVLGSVGGIKSKKRAAVALATLTSRKKAAMPPPIAKSPAPNESGAVSSFKAFIPSKPHPCDPPLSKSSRSSLDYIMNALLNHQHAVHFYDESSDTPSTPDSNASSASSPIMTTSKCGSEPFGLKEMSDALANDAYFSHMQFLRDFETFLEAARVGGGDRSRAADGLERYFRNEWAYFFPQIEGKRRRNTDGADAAGKDKKSRT
ncbi:hypothetical protein HDU82_008810 [Entophlyctis luteolus]|nr:hypothetical protein HDU82_008810 [Entophlyctis luteolus]